MPGGQLHLRHVGRRLGGNLQPALDLANLVGVLIDGPAIARAECPWQAGQLARDAQSSMLRLCRSRSARSSGVAPLPNRRSKTTCGLSSIGSGLVRGSGSPGSAVGSPTHEIELVYEQL